MNRFANLLDRLILTPSRNGKIALLVDYFATTPDPARGWAVAAITGGLDIRGIKAGAIRQLAEQHIDPVLFRLSYDYVGDLAETVSLIWPARPGANRAPPLDDVVETLLEASRAEAPALVENWLT
ncbi:MAG: ATP-dependent DNA ligase, partial [Pseudomonadota bacterium]